MLVTGDVSGTWNGWKHWLLLGLVSIISGLGIWVGPASTGATFDEPTYLDCGLKGWRERTHKPLMRLGTMPLPADLATLPLAVVEWGGWKKWNLKEDFPLALRIARTSSLVFWCLLLVAVFGLCQTIAGETAAWITVLLVCVEPNFTGHAGLATTDVASTASILLAWWAFLSGIGHGVARRLILPGAAFGFALFTKASALAYVPILLLSSDVAAWMKSGRERSWTSFRTWIRERSLLIGVGLATVFLLVGSGWGTEPTFVKWARGLPSGWFAETMIRVSENLRIFTNAGEGLAQQIKHNMRGHGAYLLGVEAYRAFVWYFPVLLLIKLTSAAILSLGLFLGMAAWKRDAFKSLHLLIAFLILLAFSLNCRVQIGIRLVFPLLVMCYALCGSLLAHCWGSESKLLKSLVVICLMGHAIESLCSFPNGLMFANIPAKSLAQPDWLMADSNFDWGQGLPHAKHEITNRQANLPIGLVYFGTDPLSQDLTLFRPEGPMGGGWDSPESILKRYSGKTLLVGATVARGAPLGAEYANFRLAISQLPWKRVGCMHFIAFPDGNPSNQGDLGRP
jgi:hypothetical protein